MGLHEPDELAERTAWTLALEHFHLLARRKIIDRAGVDVRELFGLPVVIPRACREVVGGVCRSVFRGDDAGLICCKFDSLDFGFERLLQVACRV